MKPLRALWSVFDVLEAGLVILLGAALFAGLTLGVPGMIVWTLYSEGQVVSAVLVAVLLLLGILTVARDLKARRVSWLSAVLVALWIICTAFVAIRVILE